MQWQYRLVLKNLGGLSHFPHRSATDPPGIFMCAAGGAARTVRVWCIHEYARAKPGRVVDDILHINTTVPNPEARDTGNSQRRDECLCEGRGTSLPR